MPSSLLPLELSAPFLVPTGVVPLASVCRALRAATLNNATWTEVFARRYPCLAKLPGFDKPADARGLVKSLLAAAMPKKISTPPSGQGLPPVPRDAQGRAVPLRTDVTLAVQLVRRAESRAAQTPLLKLAAPLPENLFRPDGNWRVDIFFDEIDDEHIENILIELDSALDLPRAISARVNETELQPSVAELTQRLMTNFDLHLQQEIFIVYGDAIHRLDDPSTKCEETSYLANMDELVEGDFQIFFREQNVRPSLGPENVPWLPVNVELETNSLMLSRFNLGIYTTNVWDESYDGDQSFGFEILSGPKFNMWAHWNQREFLSGSTIHERRFDEDGGEESWHWFCQLLAASPPVHFPRATS